MKKMTMSAMMQTNGGYQICNYCNHTFRNWLCVEWHQRHTCSGGLNYVFHGYSYHFSWKKAGKYEWWI